MSSDSAEPERSYCVILHTMCHKRAMPKMGAFSFPVSFLEHKWADSETISPGLRSYRSSGNSFLTNSVWGPPNFGVGGGRQAFAFAKLLPLTESLPK